MFNKAPLIKKSMIEFAGANVWIKFAKLALDLKAANLGQGFPDWSPPDFYLDSLKNQANNQNSNHQYTRSFGSLNLVNKIINNHSKYFNEKLNESNILVTNGGCGGLYNTITSLINPGDEVVLIEPFYDSYLPVAKYSGAIVRGVPLIQPKIRSKEEYRKEFDNKLRINTKLKDDWKFDFEAFSNTLNEKTKLIIINSPNNPTGKIYTKAELKEISRIIINKAPQAVVLSDEVYEHIYYDNNNYFPRIANEDGMWNRTLTLSSAGKIFSATGVRIGWLIGNEELIKATIPCHQYNTFCLYDPIQNLIADCLDQAEKPYKGFDNYYSWYRDCYNQSRTHLFNYLVNTNTVFNTKEYKLDYFLPEGSYFVVGNISESKQTKDFKLQGEERVPYSKDMAYSINLAHDKKVITIPLSVFFTPENRHKGENLVRIAFCKKPSTIDKAFDNLKI